MADINNMLWEDRDRVRQTETLDEFLVGWRRELGNHIHNQMAEGSYSWVPRIYAAIKAHPDLEYLPKVLMYPSRVSLKKFFTGLWFGPSKPGTRWNKPGDTFFWAERIKGVPVFHSFYGNLEPVVREKVKDECCERTIGSVRLIPWADPPGHFLLTANDGLSIATPWISVLRLPKLTYKAEHDGFWDEGRRFLIKGEPEGNWVAEFNGRVFRHHPETGEKWTDPWTVAQDMEGIA